MHDGTLLHCVTFAQLEFFSNCFIFIFIFTVAPYPRSVFFLLSFYSFFYISFFLIITITLNPLTVTFFTITLTSTSFLLKFFRFLFSLFLMFFYYILPLTLTISRFFLNLIFTFYSRTKITFPAKKFCAKVSLGAYFTFRARVFTCIFDQSPV